MKPIELEIYFNTEETRKLEEQEIDFAIEDCDIRPFTFYHIDGVAPYEDSFSKKWHSAVHSGGERFLCPLKYNELKKKIETHNS